MTNERTTNNIFTIRLLVDSVFGFVGGFFKTRLLKESDCVQNKMLTEFLIRFECDKVRSISGIHPFKIIVKELDNTHTHIVNFFNFN